MIIHCKEKTKDGTSLHLILTLCNIFWALLVKIIILMQTRKFELEFISNTRVEKKRFEFSSVPIIILRREEVSVHASVNSFK